MTKLSYKTLGTGTFRLQFFSDGALQELQLSVIRNLVLRYKKNTPHYDWGYHFTWAVIWGLGFHDGQPFNATAIA